MIFGFIKKYYGNFTDQELYKFTLLGSIFAIIVGIMWSLMPVRDTLFCERIIGFASCADRQARESYFIWARIIALLVLIPSTIVYGRVLNRYQKATAFYIITTLYSILFLLFFLFFSFNQFAGVPSPFYWSGWLWFLCVESFNALVVATFWAFVVDVSSQAEARKGFGFIVMLGQFGGIVIPSALSALRSSLHVSQIAFIGCAFLFLLLAAGIMHVLVSTISKKSMEGYHGTASAQVAHRKELGLLEGFKLIWMYKYLTGIALLVLFFEYVITTLDLNFKTMVFSSFSNIEGASALLSRYALGINVVTFLLLLFGINNVQRIYGIRNAFIVAFICTIGALMLFYFVPTITVVMVALIIAKAVNYSLNAPSIKQLYIPTTTDVKYQSQTWIETFGLGGAKAFGSLTGLSRYTLGNLLFFQLTSFGSFTLLCVWIVIALAISGQRDKAIEKNEIIC